MSHIFKNLKIFERSNFVLWKKFVLCSLNTAHSNSERRSNK